MPDTQHEGFVPLSPEALEEYERRALAAAVQEALDDPRPDIPHGVVREEMMRNLAELQRRMAALPKA